MKIKSKKILIYTILILTLFSSSIEVMASDNLLVKVDGKELESKGNKAYISELGRTMIPLRAISTSLGYEVKWIPYEKKAQGRVDISKDNLLLSFEIGSSIAKVNGIRTPIDIQDGNVMNTKVELKNGSTYVPLRFIIEAFDSSVEYVSNDVSRVVDIKTKGKKTPETPSQDGLEMELVTPKLQVIHKTRSEDGTFFIVRLKNFEDYKGKNAKFTAYLEDHKYYDHYRHRNPVRPEETIIVDVTERYKDRSVGEEDKWFDLYRFEKTKNHLDLKTGKIQALPKIGEKIRIRVELEMNGVKKSYFTEVPFKGGASSYKLK